ncbi:MAG: 2-oxoglutarate oxidoreductase subunit KorA [Gammaproteobacteria bacterium]|nr:2-oxoglutarate oxidoreductase subunit KorA [Gammaproteobacteria bacterium]
MAVPGLRHHREDARGRGLNDTGIQNIQGNHACAVAAVAAGCRFFAGYPITPSSEIAERISVELPKAGGTFVQMEDEIASMAAVIGASAGGIKAMTATSGPGFSLKQENLGYAAGAEIPCVIVDVMRGGPSTGMPTRPAQGDFMQSRWGTHGDHACIVLAPWSVKEIYEQTVRAFNLSETLRVPVIVLYDEVIGHLVETLDPGSVDTGEITTRKWAGGDPAQYRPYACGEDDIPPMARPGDGYRSHTTGLTHAENGFPSQDPTTVDRVARRVLGKLARHNDLVEQVDCYDLDGAQVLIATCGITARAAKSALRLLQDKGIAAGLFRPVTLWPFPEESYREAARGKQQILVPEMNAGQLIYEIQRLTPPGVPVAGFNRLDGEPITPRQIAERVEELLNHD